MRDMSQDAEPTDSALVGAYRTGDQAAAAELVRRHAAPVARRQHRFAQPGSVINNHHDRDPAIFNNL